MDKIRGVLRSHGVKFRQFCAGFPLSFERLMNFQSSERKISARTAVRGTAVVTKIAVALLIFLPFMVFAGQDHTKLEDADSAAIKKVGVTFNEAWNRHDGHAAAMLFAEDAEFLDFRGKNDYGRKAIEELLVRLFTGALKATHRTDTLGNIRFLTPEVATVEDRWVMTGTSEARPYREGSFNWVLIKKNGQWLIVVLHAADWNVKGEFK